jgi:nitrile hydratase subunit beta
VNGVHDMGGMHGFGPIQAEPQDQEPAFHAPWEEVVAMTMMAMTPKRFFSVDQFRFTIEQSPPVEYLRRSYYEKWLCALEQLALDTGLVSAEELATGQAHGSADLSAANRWEPVFSHDGPPRYRAGDRVRLSNRHPDQHTRAPRYARGRVGLIESLAGAEPLPELAAENTCDVQHVYRVRFEGTELWGPDGGPRDAVYLELWESYLEPVA